MTRFLRSILVILAFAPAARSADWKPVAPADGSFKAELPGVPKLLDRTVDGPSGPIHQVVHYCKVDGALFSIQAIETPPRVSLEERRAAAKVEQDAYLKSAGGKLVKDQTLADDGPIGWDVTLQGPSPTGGTETVTSRVRMIVTERTAYTLTVMSAKDKPLPDEVGRFFDSFHLTDRGMAGTPEEILRAFFLAVALADEAKIRVLALPADGLDWLWKGTPAPPEAQEPIKQQIARPIKTLKVGDEFTLPGNRKMTVAANELADDRVLLLPEGALTPTRMRKVDGRWRVDARPFIAARKAADAAKAKANSKN